MLKKKIAMPKKKISAWVNNKKKFSKKVSGLKKAKTKAY